MWHCKLCPTVLSGRSQVLRHYRVRHRHYSSSNYFPCIYPNCPCSFKTWNALKLHLSRCHVIDSRSHRLSNCLFNCHLCSCQNLSSEKDFWAHFNGHLQRNEVVICVFSACNFKTNVHGTFRSHKSRSHSSCSLADFKQDILIASTEIPPHLENVMQNGAEDTILDLDPEVDDPVKEKSDVVEHTLAAALLKLEHITHVPSSAIDDFLSELQYLSSSLLHPHSSSVLTETFQKHHIQIDEDVIGQITASLCQENPLNKAIEKGGSLSSTYQRRQYYKKNFNIVEPVEYILDAKQKKTFQYIPVLKSLQVLLSRKDVVDTVVSNHKKNQEFNTNKDIEYKSFNDGEYFKQNSLLSGEELSLSVGLYIDDFEVCNPLGTSRKIHKLCAVYWVLGNLPSGSNSSLSSIYLAILCKTDNVKAFGYKKVLGPLIHDLKCLETDGIFVPQLGKFLKGTVQTIAADNLGAHGLAGFVENFTGPYVCRFCTATTSDFGLRAVVSGAFSQRTCDTHKAHVREAVSTGISCCGVKKACPFTEVLSHFHAIKGYPPDIAHDLFEGIVPHEIALCLTTLISKRYITLDDINNSICHFPYKWSDKTNKPHVLPQNLQSRKSIGGNAHENWSLIRLLPFLIGTKIPQDEPAWLLLLDLKQIVELVVSPKHNETSLAYLESKISDHRHRYKELFPNNRLLPKHHFLEHYPVLIKCFGPLVGLWTMRFEAKHRFFKQVIKHTSCFKNVALSLAVKHQFMIGFHLSLPNIDKPELEVADVSTAPFGFFKDVILQAFEEKYPGFAEIQLAKNVNIKGINYRIGMIVPYGSEGGLPEFGEIDQMCILHHKVCFVLKLMCGWYNEHYGAFELTSSPTRDLTVVEITDLTDVHPLASYLVNCLRMVTLKRAISL